MYKCTFMENRFISSFVAMRTKTKAEELDMISLVDLLVILFNWALIKQFVLSFPF